jgi:hypothetical protein
MDPYQIINWVTPEAAARSQLHQYVTRPGAAAVARHEEASRNELPVLSAVRSGAGAAGREGQRARAADVWPPADFIHFADPKVASGCIVELDGGIVLLRRSIEPGFRQVGVSPAATSIARRAGRGRGAARDA